MKEIRLIRLELKNFKGIRNLELDAAGDDLFIYGRNKTGKTTIFDAFSWLLFDKDAKGDSQFDIKTHDEDHNVINGLEHTVEGVLEIEGKQLILRKTYYEKWQKKRGSAEERFTGHTTDYYIDDVPVKKKEYDSRVDEIIDEDIFKLLTDPRYFNEQLHWEERRELLLEVCGDVSNADVIDSFANLQNKDETMILTNIINSRSIDEHQKVIKSKQKKINKELEKIPTRIDEVNNNLPDISGLNREKIKAEIEEYKEKKKEKEQELSQIENGGGVVELRKKITEIDAELQKIKNDHRSEYDEKLQKKKTKLSEVKDAINDQERDIESTKKSIDEYKSIIEKKENRMQELRNKWFEENEKEFDESQFETVTCPECGHEFPLEDIEKHRHKFNQKKAEKLENISQQGKEEKEKVEQLQIKITDRKEFLEESVANLENLQEEKTSLDKEVENLQDAADMYQDSNQYKEKLKEKEQLNNKIEKVKENNKFSIETKEKELSQFEDKIEEFKDKLSDIKQHERSQDRIEELKEKERKLAKEYENLEREQYLIEEFTRTKVNLLEEKINSHFKYTKFKLFDEQVNGGLNETCEAIDREDGSVYGNTLNSGSEFKIGIDIINTFAKHFGYKAPIFIDGRESITEPLDTDSQLISLVVSPDDDKLRVEKTEKAMKEAS